MKHLRADELRFGHLQTHAESCKLGHPVAPLLSSGRTLLGAVKLGANHALGVRGIKINAT